MKALIGVSAFLSCLLSAVFSVQVTVPQTQYSTGLFVPVTLRCDYSTSANLQTVLVTWLFKSFCKDPILDYYSTAYQSALQLGQDPSNDCPDSQRTIRTVAQKYGSSGVTLGPEYTGRKITIQNQADLVITEVMWWDNGVYECSVDAPGDTTGIPNKYVKLIVYNWLTVLFMIIGAFLLIILFCVCCCQCCPQRCCCYVRCPCCPQTCCCPEKLVMQHRLMKQAQRSWGMGQPLYAPLSTHSSSYQMNPMLYAGSASGKIPMSPMPPMPLPPPAHFVPTPVPMPVSMSAPMNMNMPPPSMHGRDSANKVLDYLEHQVRDMDVAPMIPPPPVQMVHNVPFSAGPPSMLSGLDDGPASRRHNPGQSNGSGRNRQPPSSRRNMTRSYSQDNVLDTRSQVSYRPRSRSREDLLDTNRGYYDSSSEYNDRRAGGSRAGARGGARSGAYTDYPPSYSEYEPGQKPTRRPDRFSGKSSVSGTSVVI